MYSPCPIQSLASSCPVLGLFSTSVFLYTLLSFHSNYLNLALFSSSAPDSCELHNYYLVLSFLFMCSCIQVAVCLPMFFPNKTNINTHTHRMVKVLIWSVALCGAETLTMRKEDFKRIEGFEMWIWRRTERISWTEHRTNEEILKKVEENRSLMDKIRTRQKNWIGPILRGTLYRGR